MIDRQGDRVFGDGTSLAAPIVTSLAAIVKYIRPTWTASQIKYHLTVDPRTHVTMSRDGQNKDPLGNDLWLYNFISFPDAINAAILDLTANTSHEPVARFLLDQPLTPGQQAPGNTKGGFTLFSPDLATAILTRLCDTGALMLLDNFVGGFSYSPWDEKAANFIYGWAVVQPGGFSIHVSLETALSLDLWFPNVPMVPNSGASVNLSTTECDYVNSFSDISSCTGFVGDITLGNCEINQYDNLLSTPLAGSVQGEITGTFTLQDGTGTEIHANIVDKAVFRLWADFAACSADDDCRARIESMCSGGRKLVRD